MLVTIKGIYIYDIFEPMTDSEKSYLSRKLFVSLPLSLQNWFEGLLSFVAVYIFLVFSDIQSLLVFAIGIFGFWGFAKLLQKEFGWDLFSGASSTQILSKNAALATDNLPPSLLTTPQMDELQKLKKLNEYQQTFTRMLVHDLKTPLSNILSLTEAHLEEKTQKQIYEAGQHMLNLTMDMLETQKIESTSFKPTLVAQSLPQLIEGAIQQVLGLAKNKNITIVTQGSNHHVLADTRLTQRTLINLIDNAIKFSPANGLISIQIEQELTSNHTPFAKITITDQGPGIPVSEHAHIFNQFYQVQSPSQSQNTRGTGLGLRFCKMAIEAQGGQIGVCSTPQAQSGSSFWLSLPIHSQTSTTSTMMNSYTTYTAAREKVVMNQEDQQLLEPWKVKLRQYEVYQLSKIKAILKTMPFDKGSHCFQWKLDVEQALYATNQTKYCQLLH